ncbi:hypothetical protein BGZ98_008638 [Dissophora globulifera]|nr:hypothetical protein BGZ98_008638 [Dissophora globulifera]
MVELRSAPLSRVPTLSILSTESIDSSNSVPLPPSPPPPLSAWRQFLNSFTKRVIRRHLKITIAIYLGSCLTLIGPIADALGSHAFLANLVIFFIHPSRTVGSQLEVTIFGCFGAILATFSLILSGLSVVSFNQHNLAEGNRAAWVIEALWLFFGIWLLATLKTRYPKMVPTFIVYSIAIIFGLDRAQSLSFDIHIYRDLIVPILLGLAISLVVSIVFWPETASEGFGRALNESIDSSRSLLDLSTRSFLLNHKAIAMPKSVMEKAQSEVRGAQAKLDTAYKEARFEVTYSSTNPALYKEVRVIVSALMRHLGSMSLVVQNERLLMLGHPDRGDDDLQTDSDAESGYSPDSVSSLAGGDTDEDEDDHESGARAKASGTDAIRGGCHTNRTGSAELRRVRQLLMRAERSTAQMMKAREDQQRQQEQERQQRKSATSPPTPERSNSITAGGQQNKPQRPSYFLRRKSTSALADDTLKYNPSATQRILDQHSAASLTRSGSEHETRNQATIRSLRSLFTVASKPHFKPSRPPSLHSPRGPSRGRMEAPIHYGLQGGADGVNVSYTPSMASYIDQRSEAPISNSVMMKAGFEYKKQSGQNHTGEEQEARIDKDHLPQQAHSQDASGALPMKGVVFGDRKLFISFLETVRDPLQKLSDSCSRAMMSMDRELAAGLNADKDRLERIKKRNLQRDNILRKADAMLAQERSVSESPGKGRSRIATGGPTRKGVIDARSGSLPPSPVVGLWGQVRSFLGIKPRSMSQDEIDYLQACQMAKNTENKTSGGDTGLMAATSGNYEDDSGFTLPGDMSYVEYLTQELQVFDKAEAEGVRQFMTSHPALDIGPREEIFLIFFFIFALREVARELLRLGKHVEELGERQRKELEDKGHLRRRRHLWWPKIMGNFWRWLGWVGHSQARDTESFGDMAMTESVKKSQQQQPRLVAEEKARVRVKAAKEAKAVKRDSEKIAWEQAQHSGNARDGPQLQHVFASSRAVGGKKPSELKGGLGEIEKTGERRHGFFSKMWQRQTSWLHRSGNNQQDPYLKRRTHLHPYTRNNIISEKETGDTRSSTATALEVLADGALTSEQSSGRNTQHDESRQRPPFITVNIPDYNEIHKHARRLDTDKSRVHTLPMHRAASSPDFSHDPHQGQHNNSSQLRRSPSVGEKDESPLPPGTPAPVDRIARIIQRSSRDDIDVGADSEHDENEDIDAYEQPHAQSSGSSLNIHSGLNRRRSPAHKPTSPPPSKPAGRRNRVFIKVAKPRTFRYRLWEFIQVFKTDEVKYGLKMAVAMTFIGMWVLLDWTSNVLAVDRGQWSMMTVMTVLTPIVGAMVQQFVTRLGGTALGVVWAMLTYLAAPGNPYVICAMMSVFILLSAYMIIVARQPLMGLIMLLTYNSIVIGAYRDTTDTIYELCYKRAISVTLGIIVSLILNTFIWPVVARRQLRTEIAELVSRQGVFFAELMNKFLLEDPPACKGPSDGDNRSRYHSPAETTESSFTGASRIQKAAESDKRQRRVSALEQEAEPRLKAEFPGKLYEQIVKCCQNIQDRMVSMRTAAELLSPEVREIVTGPINAYRREMVGALLLNFSVLSSSLASKCPLPPYLPSARMARLRVLYNVRKAIAARQVETEKDHYTYIYYYAFSSALEELIEELELLAILIKPVVGITLISGGQGAYGYGGLTGVDSDDEEYQEYEDEDDTSISAAIEAAFFTALPIESTADNPHGTAEAVPSGDEQLYLDTEDTTMDSLGIRASPELSAIQIDLLQPEQQLSGPSNLQQVRSSQLFSKTGGRRRDSRSNDDEEVGPGSCGPVAEPEAISTRGLTETGTGKLTAAATRKKSLQPQEAIVSDTLLFENQRPQRYKEALMLASEAGEAGGMDVVEVFSTRRGSQPHLTSLPHDAKVSANRSHSPGRLRALLPRRNTLGHGHAQINEAAAVSPSEPSPSLMDFPDSAAMGMFSPVTGAIIGSPAKLRRQLSQQLMMDPLPVIPKRRSQQKLKQQQQEDSDA